MPSPTALRAHTNAHTSDPMACDRHATGPRTRAYQSLHQLVGVVHAELHSLLVVVRAVLNLRVRRWRAPLDGISPAGVRPHAGRGSGASAHTVCGGKGPGSATHLATKCHHCPSVVCIAVEILCSSSVNRDSQTPLQKTTRSERPGLLPLGCRNGTHSTARTHPAVLRQPSRKKELERVDPFWSSLPVGRTVVEHLRMAQSKFLVTNAEAKHTRAGTCAHTCTRTAPLCTL